MTLALSGLFEDIRVIHNRRVSWLGNGPTSNREMDRAVTWKEQTMFEFPVFVAYLSDICILYTYIYQ